MRFWLKKKVLLLTPVQARLRVIGKLEGEIKHFKREIDQIELRLQRAEASVRDYARSKARSSQPERWDPGISAEQEIILGFHSRIAEHCEVIEKRRRRVLDLYDEIDLIRYSANRREPEKV